MKKLISILTIVGMLSGCGMAKNLEDSGSKPAPLPTPKDNGDVWIRHPFSEEALLGISVAAPMGIIVFYGLYSAFYVGKGTAG
jgi:hypothetical protein